MLDRLARTALRWPKTILLVTFVLIALAVVYGSDVSDRLKTGGSSDPTAQSALAAQAMDRDFAAARPNLVLLVHASAGVDSDAAVSDAEALATGLSQEPGVSSVVSYWQTKAPALRSSDGTAALIAAHVDGTDAQVDSRLDQLTGRYSGTHGSVQVQVGGSAPVRHQLQVLGKKDLARAEMLGIPIIALILWIVFRSFVAAFLPLLVGIVGILGTNASLKALTRFTDVSTFALNMAIGLGLGLGVDYSLFIVRRYREELRAGADRDAAIRTTLATAGRTVLFSAITVSVAVAAMTIFPNYLLRSFGYAGVSVALLAAATALIALPAALALLGRRVDSLDITKLFRRRRAAADVERVSAWRRLANWVMRRPVVITVATVAFLLILGAPFLKVTFGTPDDRMLPRDSEPHVVQQALRDQFDARPTTAIDVVAEHVSAAQLADQLDAYARRLSALPDVLRVQATTGTYEAGQLTTPPSPASAQYATADATYLEVSSASDEVSSGSTDLVKRVRETEAPFAVQVGGPSAELVDAIDALRSRIGWALGLIAVTTVVLLFLLTGSVLIPIKAIVMNVLSLSATFGALVWIFQQGHGAGALNFEAAGWIDVTLLVLIFCLAFGVSMDYEVFLLSRIKEEYRRTGDNRAAVAFGIERTAGVVTAAALITSVVFAAMGAAQVVSLKMFGVGLALAMLMDATVVRSLLVPAVMRLAGRANWWAPAPLRWVHRRFGLSEDGAGPSGLAHGESRSEPVREAVG